MTTPTEFNQVLSLGHSLPNQHYEKFFQATSVCDDGLIAGVDLLRFDFECRLFGYGLFASLEVPADPNTAQKARHSTRRGAVLVTEPADGEVCFHV